MPSPARRDRAAPLLRFEQVNFSRNGQIILQDLSFTLDGAEIVTLIGPNGAGKSTVVNLALQLLKPDSGMVRRRTGLALGYVPQRIEFERTLPLSVRRFLRAHKNHPAARLDEALAEVGASQLGDAAMHDLSGGEMRRVLLAGALLPAPDLLVLDEPAAGLDVSGQASLHRLIQTLREQRRCGVLLVSHDLHMVMAATDRVLCVNRHLCCSGKPAEVRQHPQFRALFGAPAAAAGAGLAPYQHHHDHVHGAHGDIQPLPAADAHG